MTAPRRAGSVAVGDQRSEGCERLPAAGSQLTADRVQHQIEATACERAGVYLSCRQHLVKAVSAAGSTFSALDTTPTV